MVHTKLLIRLVDIWPQGVDLHLLTLVHQFRDLRDLVTTATHDSRHVFGRIVGLQISRLVSHPRVAGCMRLVERIRSEFLPVGPYLLEDLRIVAVLLTTLDKHRLHGIDDIFLLLTHRLT